MTVATPVGPIRDDESYPIQEFQRRSGLGKQALRQARRKGLTSVRVGNRVFIRGRDFNEFLRQHGVVK
ncbi:MAG: hypothetical protein Fues2KO_24250 [Fuerstiella sp.]